MRLIWAFGSLIAIVATFIACSSFTEGDPDSAPIDAGNGSVDSAVDSGGDAGLTSDDGGGPDALPPLPKTCAQRTGKTILCEDFENLDTMLTWTLQEANGGQVVTSPDAKRGGTVLDARIAPTNGDVQAEIERDIPWTAPFHVRFYAYMEEGLADTSYHTVFGLSHMELGLLAGRMVVNEFDPLVSTPTTYALSPSDLPLKKWTCVEWFVSTTSTTLSFDGQPQLMVSKPMNATTAFMTIGLLHRDAPTTASRSILFDDLVVSTTPVGCD